MNTPTSIGLALFAAPESLTGLPTSITLPAGIRVGQKVTLVGQKRLPKCRVMVVKPMCITLQTPDLNFVTYSTKWVGIKVA